MNSHSQWGKYEYLRPAQIDEIRRHAPIAYLPWGALEWHSYHAPIGLDGIKAKGICEAVAKETGGVVLPVVYVATDTIKPFKGFKHTIEHQAQTVATLCREFLLQLVDEGFKVIVLVTGHYGANHTKTLEEVAREFEKTHPQIGLWFMPDSEPLKEIDPIDHAAKGETSWLLYLEPKTIDLSLAPQGRETNLDQDGVWGEDPRKASRVEGETRLKALVEYSALKINELVKKYG